MGRSFFIGVLGNEGGIMVLVVVGVIIRFNLVS